MPFLAVVLPGMSIGCKHSLNRKLALYFIAPFGVLASALGYPQHHSEAVVSGTMSGVTLVVLAAIWKPLAPYRLPVDLSGRALLLGSQFMGDRLASARAEAAGHSSCSSCGGHHGHGHHGHDHDGHSNSHSYEHGHCHKHADE